MQKSNNRLEGREKDVYEIYVWKQCKNLQIQEFYSFHCRVAIK